MKRFDVIIIGGGASGMTCAIAALKKNPRLRLAIIEKNDRLGKKLLATGNGRCNLTHRDVSEAFYSGSFQKQSAEIFCRMDTEEVLRFFQSLGLLTVCDSDGRYYPLTRQASSVLDVLRFGCERYGAEVFCGETIKSLKKQGGEFVVRTEQNDFSSSKLVLACGSKASPKLGGSAAGLDFLHNFGIKTAPFSPVLCPLKVSDAVLKSLKGIRAQSKVSLLRNGKEMKTECGEVQFAENALSGICIFNLSLYARPKDVIAVDLLQEYSFEEIYGLLSENRSRFESLNADNLFTGILQKRLGQAVLKRSQTSDFSRLCGSLRDTELHAAAKTAKQLCFTVTEKSGFDQAQCAAGGAFGDEIDEATMKSKRVKGLSVCGEAIDLCGECGGYNLHFAFASGILAGESL